MLEAELEGTPTQAVEHNDSQRATKQLSNPVEWHQRCLKLAHRPEAKGDRWVDMCARHCTHRHSNHKQCEAKVEWCELSCRTNCGNGEHKCTKQLSKNNVEQVARQS